MIIAPEARAGAEVGPAGLVQAHHEIHAFCLQAGDVEPTAKGPVHEERVAPAQAVEKPA